MLKYDIHKAHRRIPVVRAEWGLLACRADASDVQDLNDDDDVFLNTCGTFGVASAGYWWSRLFAIVLRLTYWLCGSGHPSSTSSTRTTAT